MRSEAVGAEQSSLREVAWRWLPRPRSLLSLDKYRFGINEAKNDDSLNIVKNDNLQSIFLNIHFDIGGTRNNGSTKVSVA